MDLVPYDAGLLIQSSFLCPHYLHSLVDAYTAHLNVLANINSILHSPLNIKLIGNDPMLELRDIQVGAQYTGNGLVLKYAWLLQSLRNVGYSPGLIYEGYSRVLLKLYPRLLNSNVYELPTRHATNVIRLGIMSETRGNSSPGLCLELHKYHIMAFKIGQLR